MYLGFNGRGLVMVCGHFDLVCSWFGFVIFLVCSYVVLVLLLRGMSSVEVLFVLFMGVGCLLVLCVGVFFCWVFLGVWVGGLFCCCSCCFLSFRVCFLARPIGRARFSWFLVWW